MLRLPAVAGSFYPSDAGELTAQVSEYTEKNNVAAARGLKACLVPHAGYMFSGHVAGAVYARIVLPKKIVVLGVRHRPPGLPLAINSEGAWRTPLGDAPIDEELAGRLCAACPLLQEDVVAHAREHSLEVRFPSCRHCSRSSSLCPLRWALQILKIW